MHFESLRPVQPTEANENLAYELVRCFAALERMLDDDLGAPGWTPIEVADELMSRIKRRLHDFVIVYGADDVSDCGSILAEAIDELGAGELLEPDRVRAFER